MKHVAGIDVGAKFIKVVLLGDDGVKAKTKLQCGIEAADAAEQALHDTLRLAGLALTDLGAVVATGFGRNVAPHATDRVTEAMADARGANLLMPHVRTLVDVGAEEGRGIRVGPEGQVVDFAGNEKCAAGSGSFTESMARALEVDVRDFARISLDSTQAVPMNAQCTVFAESEVVSLIHANTPKADIARAVHDAIASRIAATVRRCGFEPPVALIGGVAHNPGFADSLKREMGLDALEIPPDPEFVGALGAALIALESIGPVAASRNGGSAA
ncbi:MAG: CoA activase [Candidatus Sericytochromatia bacterium]|nr:CoA activase [Candidatus Tanganyikabacteria bacterium]